MRIIAVVVASLALAGAVQAQAQTGAWKLEGNLVTTKGSYPATGEPHPSSLTVSCNTLTGRISGRVSVIPFFFPNGKAVLTWDEREEVLYTFDGLDYPSVFLLTEDLSFLDNIIGHNRLTVSAEVEIEGRRARMESRFDLSGSQAAFRTLRCWPPSARPAPGAADGAPANNVTVAPSGSPASGNLTAAQRNAVRSANSYLQLSEFSRQGLIDQLSSEFGDSYSVGDATVAVNSLSTDWNAQAARSAVSYLALSGFSYQGLIDQLSSEIGDKYTVEQATVAVNSLSTDWNAQAARSAVSYLALSGFSCQGLIDQLSSEFGDKYTVEQATYGATQAGIC